MLALSTKEAYINPALAKSSAGIGLPFIQKASRAPLERLFYVRVMVGCIVDEALRRAGYLLAGKTNSEIQSISTRLVSFGDGIKPNQKDTIMDSNTSLAAVSARYQNPLIHDHPEDTLDILVDALSSSLIQKNLAKSGRSSTIESSQAKICVRLEPLENYTGALHLLRCFFVLALWRVRVCLVSSITRGSTFVYPATHYLNLVLGGIFIKNTGGMYA